MPLDERQDRWRAMFDTISRSSLTAWKNNFMADLKNEDRPETPDRAEIYAF
jgi:trehalose-6-phosphate synthase